jgi:hypothetical protein
VNLKTHFMKKYFLFVAIALAVTASAFTFGKGNLQTRSGEIYWEFTGTSGQEGDATKYVEVSGNHPTCLGNSADLCNVFAQRDASNSAIPDLSTEIVASRTFKQ